MLCVNIMVKMTNQRTYSELIKLSTYEERLNYLRLDGKVGAETFGFDRYINQMFYKSTEWRRVRNQVIARDLGCDLGIRDREITYDKILVHHMNPISKEDIINNTNILLNPEYLITTTKTTHDMIHYGINNNTMTYIERTPNDMCPWKK